MLTARLLQPKHLQLLHDIELKRHMQAPDDQIILNELIKLKMQLAEMSEQVDVKEMKTQRAIKDIRSEVKSTARYTDGSGCCMAAAATGCPRVETEGMQCGSPEIADEKEYQYRGSMYK